MVPGFSLLTIPSALKPNVERTSNVNCVDGPASYGGPVGWADRLESPGPAASDFPFGYKLTQHGRKERCDDREKEN